MNTGHFITHVILYPISGPISGILVNRTSHRAGVIIGGLLAAFGMILSYFASGVLYLIVTFGIITGSFFAMIKSFLKLDFFDM